MEKREMPKLLSARQTMEVYGFTKTMVYRLLHMPEAGAVRIGRRRFLKTDRLEDWLNAQGERGNADGHNN